ncbi:hypothetical protein V8G54_013424 [Vigna mungo]|uniref:Uncharacterized protein n=1 Tax=Vigna mungo TaxID=3915 RepID=A0AAQ3S4A2_VIGMU
MELLLSCHGALILPPLRVFSLSTKLLKGSIDSEIHKSNLHASPLSPRCPTKQVRLNDKPLSVVEHKLGERELHLDAMIGKAKPKKHTTKEIATKIDAATTNRGGGKAGLADRSGVEKGGHTIYECLLFKVTMSDMKSMQIDHEARHPKIPFEEDKVVNLHTLIASESSKLRLGI